MLAATAGSDLGLCLFLELNYRQNPHLEPLTSLPAPSAVGNKAPRVEEGRGGVADHQPLSHEAP